MHKPPADDLETATADECLRDALRFALSGPATWRPDSPEGIDAARARFARLPYSKKLDLIAGASRVVCLALYSDLTATQPRVREV